MSHKNLPSGIHGLSRHTREPMPMEPGKPMRIDYEYQREDTCNVFIFYQLLKLCHDANFISRKSFQTFGLTQMEMFLYFMKRLFYAPIIITYDALKAAPVEFLKRYCRCF